MESMNHPLMYGLVHPYMGVSIYQNSHVWIQAIHRRMVHTSEDGPYVRAPMFGHAFQRMARFIPS